MKFKKEIVKELAYDYDFDGYEIIYTKQIDSTRWSIIYEQVFKFENKFYMTVFSMGATEMQNEEPYEFDADSEGMIEAQEVFPKEVTKVVYVTKEKL